MLIDYLRYEAYSGKLASFFEEGYLQHVKEEHLTGLHLRFDDSDIKNRMYQMFKSYVLIFQDELPHPLNKFNMFWNSFLNREYDIYVDNSLHLRADDGYSKSKPVRNYYNKLAGPPLQIIIDISPEYWLDYSEKTNINFDKNVRILFRRSNEAVFHLNSGSSVFERNMAGPPMGSLCGYFSTLAGDNFALSCAHVANLNSLLCGSSGFGLFNKKQIGQVIHHELLGNSFSKGRFVGVIDALLADTKFLSNPSPQNTITDVFPVSSIYQGQLMVFRGRGSTTDKAVQVDAFTVNKKINYGKKHGSARSVGDVLQLKRAGNTYISASPSKPGDSGSALRVCNANKGVFEEEWAGMIIGGDSSTNSSYATFAEFIYMWATDTLNEQDVDFRYIF